MFRLLFCERVQSFSLSRSRRSRLAERSRAEKSLSQNGCPYLRDSGAEAFSKLPPPTVYRRCHRRRCRRRRSATRWVVQRRGAGTTQLPRKLLHNKTACTFSYSRLLSLSLSLLRSPHPCSDDATIATDLLPFSLFSSPLRPLLFHLLPHSLFSYFLLFALSLRPAGRKSIGTVHLCRRPNRKKGGETSISRGREGSSSGEENGVSFLHVFRLCRRAAERVVYERDKPLEKLLRQQRRRRERIVSKL